MGMITFDEGHSRFNYRAGAIIVRNEHVLLNTMDHVDMWWIPGGRIDMREVASEALRREIREELDVEIRVGQLIWVVENFFHLNGRDFHELEMLFHGELPEDCDLQDHEVEYVRDESGRPLYYRWFPLVALDDIRLGPSFLKSALRNIPATTQHIVHIDPSR
jgi:ADP-ribose pyrophosphatase YjhB (NUDIX family)